MVSMYKMFLFPSLSLSHTLR